MRDELRGRLARLQALAATHLGVAHTCELVARLPNGSADPDGSIDWIDDDGELRAPDCAGCAARRRWCVMLHADAAGHPGRFLDCGLCRTWSRHGACRPGHWCGHAGCPRGGGSVGPFNS